MICFRNRKRNFSDNTGSEAWAIFFEKVVERVSILFQLEKDYITARGRQKDRVRARDLLCYWAVVELEMPMVDLARKFAITPAAVSYAVQRGEKMAKE